MNDCVFCQIIAGTSPATVVQRTAHTLAFVPLTPVTDGHVLFVPLSHHRDAADYPESTACVFHDAAQWAAERGEQFNLITSAGRAATQSIFHHHAHYVPRREDDDLMVPWGTLYGDNPADPHMCRGLREIARHWRARRDLGPHRDPRYRPNQRVGEELAAALDRIAGADRMTMHDNREETTMSGKFEVYPTAHGTHRFRLKASNGEVVATGVDGGADYPTAEFQSADAAKAGCGRVLDAAKGAEIVEVEE